MEWIPWQSVHAGACQFPLAKAVPWMLHWNSFAMVSWHLPQVCVEDAWTGEVVLVKRNYEISDETQPFSIGLVTALIFRERWIVRDVAICAIVLSLLALTPIIFWRLLSDKVIYFKAYNTFFVVCLAMVVLVLFEAVFAYLRQFLVVHLTTRVDVKLSTYMFDKLFNLPIDFFERTQTGTYYTDVRIRCGEFAAF